MDSPTRLFYVGPIQDSDTCRVRGATGGPGSSGSGTRWTRPTPLQVPTDSNYQLPDGRQYRTPTGVETRLETTERESRTEGLQTGRPRFTGRSSRVLWSGEGNR